MADLATLPALAVSIAKFFPELGGRVLAVSEAEVNKTNIPTMPLAMLALTVSPIDHNVESNKPPTITEDFVVEFWFETNKYQRRDNSESPFWAYYDFDPLRDKFMTLIRHWRSPRGYKLRFMSMEVETSDLAVMVVFRLTHIFEWCEPDEILEQLFDEPVNGQVIKNLSALAKVTIVTKCCPEPICVEKENPLCP